MSSCMLLFIVLCIGWLRLEGGAWSNLEAKSQNSSNHTTRTNKVRDPFCKRKWFGIDKWVWEHVSMPTFMSEGQISTARLQLIIRSGAEKFSGNIWPSVIGGCACLFTFKYEMSASQRCGCQRWSSPFRGLFRTLTFSRATMRWFLLRRRHKCREHIRLMLRRAWAWVGKLLRMFSSDHWYRKWENWWPCKNIPIREKVSQDRDKALRDPAALHNDTGVLKIENPDMELWFSIFKKPQSMNIVINEILHVY